MSKLGELIDAILLECTEKHQINPFNLTYNADYGVSITLSMGEIREAAYALLKSGKPSDALKEYIAQGKEEYMEEIILSRAEAREEFEKQLMKRKLKRFRGEGND